MRRRRLGEVKGDAATWCGAVPGRGVCMDRTCAGSKVKGWRLEVSVAWV